MKKDDIKTKENIAKLEKVIEEKKSIPKEIKEKMMEMETSTRTEFNLQYPKQQQQHQQSQTWLGTSNSTWGCGWWGSGTNRSLEFPSLPRVLGKFQATERSCIKNQSGQHLRNNS